MRREDVVKTINNLKGESGHQRVLNVYNAQNPLPRDYKLQTKDPWCAATVSAVLITNGYNDLSECSCTVMVKKAKDLGIWIESDSFVPQVGDIVLYDWQDDGKGDNQGNPDHIGIVIKVGDGKMTIREGNKSKTVGNRTVEINGKFIRGFITPPYEDAQGFLDEKIEEVANNTPIEEKSEEKPQTASHGYIIGNTYTIYVKTTLYVRKGPGKNYDTVPYNELTDNAKLFAIGSALRNKTRVTCKAVQVNSATDVWMKIPSGWICAIEGNRRFVK